MGRSAAQIFLRSNGLLTRKLEQKDIKKRLLGHWVRHLQNDLLDESDVR